MKKMLPQYLLLSLVLVFSHMGAASASESKPMFKLGYDAGGDTMVTALFTNGSQDNIKANEGLYIGGGVSIVSDDKKLETELTLSYKFQTITASNGDVTWTRVPLEGLVFYRFPQVRVGGGLTYHLNPTLSGSGLASGIDTSYDDALGTVLQADWRLTERMNIGLRYTQIDYKLSNPSATVKSNGVGIVFSGSF